MTIEISAIVRQSWEVVRPQRTDGHISLLHSLWNLKGVTLFIDFVVLKAISNIFKLLWSIETRVQRTRTTYFLDLDPVFKWDLVSDQGI